MILSGAVPIAPTPLAHVWYTLGAPTDGCSFMTQHVHVVPAGVTARFIGDLRNALPWRWLH
jgi:hypothetical protein